MNRLDHFGQELSDLLRRAADELARVEGGTDIDFGEGVVACQALERMIVGGLIADVIAVIGSIDVVMGDVDR